jgi:peptide/nickel transport system substrate-binding protein
MSLFRPRGRLGHLTRAAVVAVALSLSVAACGSGGSGGGGAGAGAADTLVVVTPDQGISWAVDAAYPGGSLPQNTQATLIRKPYVANDASKALSQDIYDFEGYLADSYDVSADQLTYTFHLDPDATSTAGNKLTADDVLWSYERKFNTPTAITPALSYPAITDPATQIKKIDEHTVSFTIADVSSGFTLLALLADVTGQIYDSTLLKQHVTADDPYAVEWSTQNPNYGFGAYSVEKYEAGVQTTLKANPGFVLGEPKIKTIVSRVVADAGQRVNAVKNGEADMAENLPQADLADLASTDGIFVPDVDDPNSFLSFALVTNKPPFDDVKVRQAMAYAVPYDDIIKNVYYGRAVRNSPGILRSDTPGYDDSGIPMYTYDPDKAKALLAEAGHADGVSFTLTVSAATPAIQEAATQIQTAAKAAGFDIKIDQQPAGSFYEGLVAHDYQASMIYDYAVTLSPPYELLLYTTPDDTNNRADWTDQEFVDLVDQGIAAGDPLGDAAGSFWQKAMSIYVDQVPIDYVLNPQPDLAMAADIDGYAWRTDNTVDYSNLSRS